MGDVVELNQTSSMMKGGRTPVLYMGDRVRSKHEVRCG